jgi:HAD superfamily hydrolase (TIGR01490 family)
MATLALFDFDHTLYKKDSLLEFTKFHCGSAFYIGMLKLLPQLIGMKVGFLDNEKVKSDYITHFFGNIDYAVFAASAARFAKERIDAGIDQKFLAKMQQHLKEGHQVYIVTASAPEWIQPWSGQYNVSVIGTKLETKDGILTGNFASPNCQGLQKVSRIRETIDLDAFEKIFVYGKGKGDRDMLKLQKF